MEKGPIFVLGCDRSGTSLLRRILDAHNNIACPPETKFIYQLVKVYETPQSLAGLRSMGFSDDDVLEQMRVFICQFLDGYAKAKGKTRWAEKTTHNVNCAVTIDKAFFQSPQYVAIIRHGLDVAHSLATLDFSKVTVIDKYRTDGADTAMATVRHWAVMNTKIVDFQQQVGDRLILIKYEDLTREPEATLRKVFGFLDETWEASLLDYNRVAHDSGYDDPNAGRLRSIIPNSGNYRVWSREYQEILFDEAREVFSRFDYEL